MGHFLSSRHRLGLLSLILLALPLHAWAAGPETAKKPIYSCSFAAEHWNASDWVRVKNPHGDFGSWVQEDACIANHVPAGASPEEILRKHSRQTYTSMVYKEKVTGNATISSTMAFDHKQAPLIVLAGDIPDNGTGMREYRDHFEIIIFYQGVNIWHHFVQDGKLTYRLIAFAKFPLEKDTKYTLEVKKTGKTLTASVGGHTFGCYDEALPDSFYAGITGCEGLNRFYDFAIRH